MTITHEDWRSMLLGCTLSDAWRPALKLCEAFLPQWAFYDAGATYVPYDERDTKNPGAIMFDTIRMLHKINRDIEKIFARLAQPSPDFDPEHSRRINYVPESWVLM